MTFREKFIFGTASLHHLFTRQRIFNLLDTSYDAGFRVYDTSPYYGLGYNEFLLLEWIKCRGLRDIIVHTKVGLSYTYFRSKNIGQYSFQRLVSSKNFREKPRLTRDIRFYRKYPMVSFKTFLHEPSRHSDVLRLMDEFDFYGLAGDFSIADCPVELTKIVLQVPFENYPLGNIHYGIYTGTNKFDFSLKGRFIYSSRRIERILEFRSRYDEFCRQRM